MCGSACPSEGGQGWGGGGGLSQTALTGRMRKEGLYLSCLLCSWYTDGPISSLQNVLMKSRRRAWLNMEQPACLLWLPHHHKANSSVSETVHSLVGSWKTFVVVAGLYVRSSVFNQSLQAGVAVELICSWQLWFLHVLCCLLIQAATAATGPLDCFI